MDVAVTILNERSINKLTRLFFACQVFQNADINYDIKYCYNKFFYISAVIRLSNFAADRSVAETGSKRKMTERSINFYFMTFQHVEVSLNFEKSDQDCLDTNKGSS
jgi:hypothetical protein